ncbi:hypothetical protein BD309DRAFT_682078 [Dichomitus squalens]|nr:hypothetical protein BD309DRAFT_682078 [Dichomitus squalens]
MFGFLYTSSSFAHDSRPSPARSTTSLLLLSQQHLEGNRLMGAVRHDQGLKIHTNVSSTYKPVGRSARRFTSLKLPKKLQASLLYVSKPALMKVQYRATYMQKRAVVMEPEEKKAMALLQQVRALRKSSVCSGSVGYRVYQALRSNCHYSTFCSLIISRSEYLDPAKVRDGAVVFNAVDMGQVEY